jgi:hypothetical protein
MSFSIYLVSKDDFTKGKKGQSFAKLQTQMLLTSSHVKLVGLECLGRLDNSPRLPEEVVAEVDHWVAV